MKKLLELQKKIGVITKDETNPFFKSKYFDINKLVREVKPILNDLGLVLIQPLCHVGDKPALRTMLIEVESGEKLADDIIVLPENIDPQKMGSAITYFRRYAVQSLLFLEAEDDDGNLAKPKQPVAVQPQRTAPQAASTTANACKDCGAPMVVSKTKGTIYCSGKCWLNPPPF